MNPREYPHRPWVGIGVVALRGEEVLLIRRGRPPRQGEWSLPGGGQRLGEPAEACARRELLEEIGWAAGDLPFWFTHSNPQRIAHFFRPPLTLPLQELRLLEGQDMVLASEKELGSGQIWSPRLGELRPLAPSLQCAMERLRSGMAPP